MANTSAKWNVPLWKTKEPVAHCSKDPDAPFGENPVAALLDACTQGNMDDVLSLLEKNIDVNSTDERCYTPLMCASRAGHADVVRALLENNANIEATDDKGMTSLMWASLGGHSEIVRVLLIHSASVDTRDSDCGRTALMYAVLKGHMNVVKTLIDLGNADVNAQSKDNMSVVRHSPDDIDIETFLLDSGCVPGAGL